MTALGHLVSSSPESVEAYRALLALGAGRVDAATDDAILCVGLAEAAEAGLLSLTGAVADDCVIFASEATLRGLQIAVQVPAGLRVTGVRIALGRIGSGRLLVRLAGSGGRIVIGDCGAPFEVDVRVADEGEFVMGDMTTVGKASFMVGRNAIRVGRDCLFSSNIHVVAANDHGIVDLDTGELSQSGFGNVIEIGNHVWVGLNACCIGNAVIGDGVIVAANAVVASDVEKNMVVAGNPAQVKKSNTTWSRFARSIDPATERYIAETRRTTGGSSGPSRIGSTA